MVNPTVEDGISELETAISTLIDEGVLSEEPFKSLDSDGWGKVFDFYRDAGIIAQVEALVLLTDNQPKYAAWKMAMGCPEEYLGEDVVGRRQLQRKVSRGYETTSPLREAGTGKGHDLRRIPDQELGYCPPHRLSA